MWQPSNTQVSPSATAESTSVALPSRYPNARLRQEVRRLVHVLHAARDDDLGIAGPDLGGREHDRLEPGSADPVDRRRRRRVGQPRGECRLAGRCLADSALQHLAHQDLVDRRAVGQPGPLHRRPDRDPAERRRRRVRQDPAELADRRPRRADEEDLAVPAGHRAVAGGVERRHQRVRGNPRSTFDVPGSGQRWVTILARV